MNVAFNTQDIFTGKHDGVALFTYEERSEAEMRFGAKLGRNAGLARERKEFSGKRGELFVETQAASPRFCMLVGLGKRADVSAGAVREGAGAAALRLRDLGAKHIAIEAPMELDAQAVGQAVAEGAMLSTYQFTRYKTVKVDEIKAVESITVVSERSGLGVRNGVEIGRTIAESCNLVRDLQNTPSCDLTPEGFAREAMQVCRAEKLPCKVLDRKQLEKQGYGGILAVGKGSPNEPRLITIEYFPKGAKRTIALVGKGITFDTGGISIKPADRMGEMKFDMSGAAAVLGAVRNAARLRLPVRVVGVMALAENMPDGRSYKPGDIVRTKSGKTIEVDNTDAEGRVVLADALHHAAAYAPDIMVDLATLTGACVVALGDVAAGLLGNDEKAIDAVRAASLASGERVWQLPLWDEYEKDIKSSVADVKNVGIPRLAGTIAGAMFLKQFAGSVPWAHLDIAGVAWASGREIYFTPSGSGTAFGVRLMTELLRAQAQ